MKVLRIILLVLVLVIALVALGGFLVFNDWTRGPLPQLDGEIRITLPAGAQSAGGSSLNASVEIIRDQWGVPHIYASNSHDLLWAQGYTQAQDRWWQMEFFRATGDGRLEELTGKNDELLGSDLFIRTIGWRRAAEREIAGYDADTLALLQAFTDGVNAYIFSRPKDDLALEYSLLGVTGVTIEIKPWTVADIATFSKVQAWGLSDQLGDLTRSRVLDQLGEEMLAAYEPPWPFGEKPTIVQPEDLPIDESTLTAAGNFGSGIVGLDTRLAGNLTAGDTAFLFGSGDSIGSNNWVIGGERTETGMPLLANDPHLGIQMPSIWYEIGLHCQPVGADCPFDVVGFAFAPAPGVIIGHNANIAWGLTNVGPDVIDLYRITVNPDNPLQYQWNGEWRDMIVHDETINFGDGEPSITIQVRETHLGPIINDNRIGDDGEILGFNTENPVAFRWTALEPSQLSRSIFMLNTASNWEEFREAASFFSVPAQNMVYADIEGNIGYQTPGLIPIRTAGHNGLLPVDGSTDEFEWQGYIPFDDLPRIYNPARGYIATANQALVPLEYYEQLAETLADQFGADSNYFIDTDWDYGFRGERLVELLEATEKHTIDSVSAIQGDNKNLPAEALAPALAALTFDTDEMTDLRDWLLNWDYMMHMDSPQAALYGYFWARLVENLYQDELGDITIPDGGSQQMWSAIILAGEADNPWWDDITTTDVTETRDDILIRSLTEAYDLAKENLGANRDNWKWGDVHTATFVSNPLGASGIDLIENIVNRGPVAASGGDAILNATGWDEDTGYLTLASLPSMRMIVDLGNLDNSVTIHTTGQSGHPYSSHYGDMIDLWRNIQHKPMLWSRAQVEANAASTLTLTPGSS